MPSAKMGTRESVLERIRKSLALSASSNPNEAAAAMATAHRLLAEHNLSIDEVTMDLTDDGLVIESEGINIGNKNWRWRVWNRTATANYCTTYAYEGWNRKTLHVVGRPTNVAATRDMAKWLCERLDAMGRACQRSRPYGYSAHTWRNSYLTGAVGVLASRLWELQQQDKVAPDTQALVVRLDLELEDYMKHTHPDVTTRRTSAVEVYEAPYQQGQRDARNLSLHPVKQVQGAGG